MNRVIRWIGLWLPVVIWAGVIFYLSHLPNLRITHEWWDYPLRKMCHMGEYGLLAILLARAFSGSIAWPRAKIVLIAWMGAVLYAISDEFHQRFVPGRAGAPLDVAIDSIGAWLALYLLRR